VGVMRCLCAAFATTLQLQPQGSGLFVLAGIMHALCAKHFPSWIVAADKACEVQPR
jgi:hypothetical protein